MKNLSQPQRRQRSKRRQGRTGSRWRLSLHESEWPIGPDVTAASAEEVMAAVEALPPKLGWQEMAPHLIPLFERLRPYPAAADPPLLVLVPPGVRVGLGIDIGPALMAVTQHLADEWSVAPGDLAARALANLHSLAAGVRPDDVVRGPLAGIEAAYLETRRGIGSVLVLAPSELPRLFGDGPRRFIAPMRDLLIGLPHDVDPELAAWLYAEIASQDPNCLHPRLFGFDGRQVTIEPLLAPN